MTQEFHIGQQVRLVTSPAYVKTADPMPMLRPASIIQVGEAGTVLNRHPGGYWSIRFTNGTFLLDEQYLESLNPEQPPS